MENAVDALIMAGSVLLLIIALTVSISSFTSLKTQVDTIISEREETDLVTDDEGNYLNYIESADDIRTVGVETVLSTARRARREQYTVYIYGSATTSAAKSSSSDLKDLVSSATKTQYYNSGSGSSAIINAGSDIITIGVDSLNEEIINDLREILNDHSYKEYLGIYQEETAEEVSSANKTTYRIITFVET